MRVLPMVLLFTFFTVFAFAEPPKVPATSVEERVVQLERRVAQLERQLADERFSYAFEAVKGIWQLRGNEILSPTDPVAQLQLPGSPPEEFILSLHVRRLVGHNTFAVQLPMAGQPVLVALDAHGGTVSGLEFLDGKCVQENAATFRGALLSKDVDTSISITVRKSQIVCSVNDVKVIDWQGDVNRLKVPDSLIGPNRGAIHITTLNCQYAISRVSIGNISDKEEAGWKNAALWESDVVSARILFKPSASLADRDWLGLEIENHTHLPLEFGQTWMNLKMTLKEIPSGKVLAESGLSGTIASIKKLAPGRHRFYEDTFRYASANMGLPPVTGVDVDVQAKIDTEVREGPRYQTPADGTRFKFEWRYPSEAENILMCDEIKQYLAHQDNSVTLGTRMSALFKSPQVVESLTMEDYLPALKASSNSNIRHMLVYHVFVKYRDDPKLLAYYREAFQKEPDAVYRDAAVSGVWNEEFLEPLIQGCEKDRWDCFSLLSSHKTKWRNNPSGVARLSAALLKHHPILQREVRTISDKELETWAKAAVDSGTVPDQSLVELLKPALDDQRQARINHGSGGWNEGRVCDRALFSILGILDGDSWAAFKGAGIEGWRTEEERLKACDKMIGILVERLKSLPIKK